MLLFLKSLVLFWSSLLELKNNFLRVISKHKLNYQTPITLYCTYIGMSNTKLILYLSSLFLKLFLPLHKIPLCGVSDYSVMNILSCTQFCFDNATQLKLSYSYSFVHLLQKIILYPFIICIFFYCLYRFSSMYSIENM